jgi:hypothetical protein
VVNFVNMVNGTLSRDYDYAICMCAELDAHNTPQSPYRALIATALDTIRNDDSPQLPGPIEDSALYKCAMRIVTGREGDLAAGLLPVLAEVDRTRRRSESELPADLESIGDLLYDSATMTETDADAEAEADVACSNDDLLAFLHEHA